MRSRISVVGLMALLPLGALVAWWLTPSSPISQANCDRIQSGMTEDDVERILGGPGKNFEMPRNLYANNNFDSGRVEMWADNSSGILVRFVDDRVEEKLFVHTPIWERAGNWFRAVMK